MPQLWKGVLLVFPETSLGQLVRLLGSERGRPDSEASRERRWAAKGVRGPGKIASPRFGGAIASVSTVRLCQYSLTARGKGYFKLD